MLSNANKIIAVLSETAEKCVGVCTINIGPIIIKIDPQNECQKCFTDLNSRDQRRKFY